VFERHLARALEGAGEPSPRLGAALRYAALSPGKRLRPLLTLAACEAVGGKWQRALPAAAAIECVHAFSLVHDDLPAMDDDYYRRGRLTTHKRFGEALGVLAGDALLAFAFEELTRLAARGVPARRVVEAVSHLAWARHKTGGLMGAALALGAIAGGARTTTVERLAEAGSILGLAFQIQDDLLNSRSSLRRLGKRTGTDRARGKATFLKVRSEAQTREALPAFFDLVEWQVEKLCRRPRALLALIDAVAKRKR
jgi:geranylgeranyl diphosphate synthase type II